MACASDAERRIAIVAVPMTAGGDVLFPGGSQMLSIRLEDAIRASKAANSEFGYVPINAWNDPSPVGTLAVVDEFEPKAADDSALMLCSGLQRFRLLEIDPDRTRGVIECFNDDPIEEERLPEVHQLEDELVKAMTEIVRLSIKISGEQDQQRQKALAETLKRVEAFCGRSEKHITNADIHHWFVQLTPDKRREILSFIVLDLLSLSFMSRRSLMLGTDTEMRLKDALDALEPFLKELAAKGAIISALGKQKPDQPQVGT